MKKACIIISLILSAVLIFTIERIYAAGSYNVRITADASKYTAGQDAMVTFTLCDITMEPGIGAISGKIEYDDTVFLAISDRNINSGSGWGNVTYNSQNGRFIVEREQDPSTGDIVINTPNILFDITFTVRSDAEIGETQIKLSELCASDGNQDVEVDQKIGTITIVETDITPPTITGIENGGMYNTSVTPVVSDTNIETIELYKDGTKVNGYTNGDTITENGSYEIIATDESGNRTVFSFSIDKVNPIIYNVVSNAKYNTDVTPIVVEDNIDTVELFRDGNKIYGYTIGMAVSGDGNYEIVAKDRAGNETRVSFQIDATLPVINGVTTGTKYNEQVTPVATDNDLTIVELYRNNNKVTGYNNGDTISIDGNYTIIARDGAGNETQSNFIIDTTLPEINGVTSNATYNNSVTPIASDNDLVIVELYKDGSKVNYTNGTTISDNGNYTIIARDGAGNERQVSFKIDWDAPTISGVTTGTKYNTQVRPVATDGDLATVELYKNSSKVTGYNNGDTISEDGSYTIIAKDRAGNETQVSFVIDTTLPEINGVTNNATYKNSVTPTASDNDLAIVELYKDGNKINYTNGTTISDNGSYIIIARDGAGNERQVSFKIDSDAPAISGVTTGTKYNTEVRPVATDGDLATVELYKNSSKVTGYNNGDTISKDGSYTIIAKDRAGNETQVSFVIDTTLPEINGVTNNATYKNSVTPTASDNDLATVELYKDGNKINYTNGTTISDNGSYIIIAKDGAGNERQVSFKIDWDVPTISGVTAGTKYNRQVAPVATDNNLATVELYKDNNRVTGYNNGDTISQDGNYTIIAKDTAGNETRVSFIIDTVAPTVSGVKEGIKYDAEVMPIIHDDNITILELYRNGNKVNGYRNGNKISENGNYVLVAKDEAGNETRITFTIAIPQEEPTPENPTPENPTPENPTPENPTPENPTPENPTPENPTPENPTPENPTPENPTPENPTPENPTPENPTSENPTPENPTPENPTSEKPTQSNPSTEKPSGQTQSTEKPASTSTILPYAGDSHIILLSILVTLGTGISIMAYIRIRKMKSI